MCFQPEFFVFCEKRTGAARFRVPVGDNGKMSEDQAASLLAMHCLVRGQAPGDYMVMVAAGDDLFRSVASRATELLELGQASICPTRLSRREEEVLGGVAQNLANKEIAAKLGLSERTVKFHVSSLLAKFRVRDRVSLMREAASALLPSSLPAAVSPSRSADLNAPASASSGKNATASSETPSARRAPICIRSRRARSTMKQDFRAGRL